jgi:excisionase family DNA binding protein
MCPMDPSERLPRFLTLADVAEILATSTAQVYALVRRGDLRALKIGGRGQWRVEAVELEAFIQRMYEQTDAETARVRSAEDAHTD